MELTRRQEAILGIVKAEGPITSEQIAERLNVARATLRPDLALLTMAGLLEARPRVGYYYTGKSPYEVVANKIRRYRVKDLHSRPVVVSVETTVYDALITLFLEDVGTLFVVREGGFLEGVVSRKDFLKLAFGGQDFRSVPVSVIMTRRPHVITTTPEESAWEAARKIVVHEVDALPVVEPAASGQDLLVVGRFSKTNVTRLFVEMGEGR
ncbi:CBS domain containing protein [Ammonifex degensii KC4]|uniref:CBS domain containing protein n=1 Tax=Ammonifex degensii (strain DSM 10501 / KC4) TaxID=429009 RepID=C9R945_AMMDK|nr:helix-turn-helix transcriptional regulator [Ammonifex degensii]ACX52824.1 CBS domain containing protein [Ammonifex degensii KC4]